MQNAGDFASVVFFVLKNRCIDKGRLGKEREDIIIISNYSNPIADKGLV